MVKLFISHSSEDAELAQLVVQLFTIALGLKSKDILCTSVEGYRLRGGANVDEQLREEVLVADCFIALVSPQSLSSIHVLFELGARWGAKKHLVPLLAHGMKPHSLKGPLTGLNALRCDNMAELHQLITEIGQQLEAESEPSAVFQRSLEAVVYYATTGEKPVTDDVDTKEGFLVPPAELSTRPTSGSSEDEYPEAPGVIARYCEREWPDDYGMRVYCIEQQEESVAKLRLGRPEDVPDNVFRNIRQKCAREWPDDYNMRLYSEEQQIVAFRKLRAPRN